MKLLFEKKENQILSLYRIVYPLLIISSLSREIPDFIARADSKMCYPIPLFKFLSIPILDRESFFIFSILLICLLISLTIGLLTKVASLSSLILFIWVLGSSISCTAGEHPDYIPWNHSIVAFNLFVLFISPSQKVWSIDSILFKYKSIETTSWPIFLFKFNLVYAYFSGGVAKLRYGLDWTNGYTLQGHLIYTHLHIGTPHILPWIKSMPLMILISYLVLVVEILFPLALFNRFFAIFFISGTLVFQAMFYFLINLRWMDYFGWSYLIYLLEILFFMRSYFANKSAFTNSSTLR